MSLGANYRFTVINAVGVNLTNVALYVKRWKYGATGLVWDTESTPINAAGPIASGGSTSGSWTDNTGSSDLWEGADCVLAYTGATSASGQVKVHLERSTDVSASPSHLPDAGNGTPVFYAQVSASGAKKHSFQL